MREADVGRCLNASPLSLVYPRLSTFNPHILTPQIPDYMFRIDKEIVCDATRKGSLARFVNHACDVS